MGGFFGVTSKQDCVLDVFFGVDYHSHLGTRRGGMAAIVAGDLMPLYTTGQKMFSSIKF